MNELTVIKIIGDGERSRNQFAPAAEAIVAVYQRNGALAGRTAKELMDFKEFVALTMGQGAALSAPKHIFMGAILGTIVTNITLNYYNKKGKA